MKNSMLIRLSLAALVLSALFAFTACDKDDDDVSTSVYKLSGEASGAQEVPAVNTQGMGTIEGRYDTTKRSLQYKVTWTGLSGEATAAHFHGPASPGENAPPMQDITITVNGTSGIGEATVTASSELHAALMAGKVYYNIHTADFPEGEIRGQVQLKQ